VPISRENVSAFAAITKQTINISDVYNATGFDFTGPERYDASTGYRSQSMLVVPMKNSRGEVIGVLQLINAMDAVSGKVISFSYDAVKFVESLASQAAVTITNIMMLKETEDLFNSVVKVMATAIDEKSPYSGGHIQRVAEMALELAKLVNEEKEGPLGILNFTEAQLHEIYIAGLMHDMGKVSTPEWIMDKATRLEKIFDRVHLVRERFLKIMNALKVEKLEQRIFMQAQGASKEEIETHEKDMDGKINGLKEDLEFVTRCNSPGELMDEEKTARIRRIASNTYMEDGQALPYLTDDEIKNLCIRKGSITEEEYAIMQNHASVTIRMLEHIPFVESLKNVPLYAGSHHERICGSGYPKGLKGDQIPIQARILALVDIFEALTAKDRPYKKPLSLEIALKILKEEVEAKHLDLNLFDLFLKTKFYERME
jgi:HD-GYP domain-containing protein (c-di-GMP phosphodiesterase class II)